MRIKFYDDLYRYAEEERSKSNDEILRKGLTTIHQANTLLKQYKEQRSKGLVDRMEELE